METTIAHVFEDVSFFNDSVPSLMEVHIVDTNDIFYKKGRILAENVYRQTWGTENLIDGNNYAVVVCQNGNVLGNMNIQTRAKETVLKSETFFGLEHWKNHFQINDEFIAEVSALAISRNLSQDFSRLVMMSLITGVINFCRIEGIQLLVTVQHEYLIRVLTKSLHLPFVINQDITKPKGTVPNDEYWNRDKLPRLYYLEPLSSTVAESCYSYVTYLTLKGVPMSFFPRTQRPDLSYATFWKNLHQMQSQIA